MIPMITSGTVELLEVFEREPMCPDREAFNREGAIPLPITFPPRPRAHPIPTPIGELIHEREEPLQVPLFNNDYSILTHIRSVYPVYLLALG